MKLNGSAVQCLLSTQAALVRFPTNASFLFVLIIKSHIDKHCSSDYVIVWVYIHVSIDLQVAQPSLKKPRFVETQNNQENGEFVETGVNRENGEFVETGLIEKTASL